MPCCTVLCFAGQPLHPPKSKAVHRGLNLRSWVLGATVQAREHGKTSTVLEQFLVPWVEFQALMSKPRMNTHFGIPKVIK